MNEKFWFLKQCNLFGQLSDSVLSELETTCFVREFQRGEMVYLPTDHSDSVLLLASGRIRIFNVTPEGKQAILGFVEPGEVFGELSCFQQSSREEYSEAMVKSRVVLMPHQSMQQLMARSPEVSMKMTRLFGLRLKRIQRRLKALLFRTSREKVIHLLLELAEKYGKKVPNGLLINQKLSHQDMASIIGATRETVTITLGELQDEGIVSVDRRLVTLRNAERLAESIDFGPVNLQITNS